ncbi:MAG: hypothetical protein C6W58_07040 [Bacillaceae bacterium]|mgnify:FL=1|jgi:hypothetical protein|uniref:Resolvase HTH domain-containing protein n=2 Tax=Aeribacillus TaxID=1055323 RepID=A0A161Y3S9_9BACI|nr:MULTISPECIES: hypothetical protein [Aeribacillus]REJ18499.1 MAG: hypothetical protein C6W58_07040 [Bacillaceae bacterium]ASS91916.1 hypothetical protein AP3564_18155 [Aeribacillus pallidus]KZM56792.1 hypothetical protein A3Q35_07045 [Aeribacillus pallidus]KZN96322.1 hypothetical protein AZI98_09715 [Aeribacillus pallidus]MDR9793364.1 hypothetical protein [Aeribacillus pallidus]
MEIVIIILFLVSIALLGIAYTQRDDIKELEQEVEHLSVSAMQEIYKMKKKMRVLEEELLQGTNTKPVSQDTQSVIHFDYYTKNKILSKYQQGMSIAEIAKSENATTDEVKLIIEQNKRELS